MENMLALLDSLPSIAAPEIADEKQTSFLPYITIIQGLSALAAPPHQVQQGSIVLHIDKNHHEVLGKEVDLFICDMRYKAMHFDDKKITTIYDKEDPLFQEIKRNADDKVKKYAWGYDFLFYLGDSGRFATLFCSSVSSRIAAGKSLAPVVRQVRTFKTDFVTHNGFSWWSFTTEPCEIGLSVPPNQQELINEITAFQKTEVQEESVDTGALEDR